MDIQPSSRWRDGEISLFVLTEADVGADYVAWLNDPDIARFLESRFATHDLASTRAFVAAQHASPAVLFLGIRSEALGRHVGNIKLGPIDRHHRTAEIGIMIGARDAWGQGIGARAIRMVCDIARDELNLRKVTAGCYQSNQGSERAFERAGFRREGLRHEQFLLDGKPEDLILMGRVLSGAEKKDT